MHAPAGPIDGPISCADCGAQVERQFCPECGQSRTVPRTLGALAANGLHAITHFDGRLWHTLPLLARQPGRLTRAWVDGQRTRHMAPGALFLLSALLMFLSFNLAPMAAPPPRCDAPAKGEIALDAGAALRKATEGRSPAVQRAADVLATAAFHAAERATPALRARIIHAASNPELLLAKLKQSAYKSGFLLIPLSLPALWLLLRGVPGADLYALGVFSLYSLAFMSLLLMVTVLLGGTGLLPWPVAGLLLLLVPPLHLFRHVRDAFALSNGQAVWRTALFVPVALGTLAVFLGLLLAVGLL